MPSPGKAQGTALAYAKTVGDDARAEAAPSNELDPNAAGGSPFMDLNKETLAQLRRAVTGSILTPQDPEYDSARTTFYGGIDRRPGAIVRVAGAEDVARLIPFARERDLELAIRSGGHSAIGHSLCDGGIVLDLKEMRALDIDVPGRTAWAETGLTAGSYTAAAGAHGLATDRRHGSVGIGGLTLGGGVGYLVRKFGLTIDDLLAAEVITADGQRRQADAERSPNSSGPCAGGGNSESSLDFDSGCTRSMPSPAGCLSSRPPELIVFSSPRPRPRRRALDHCQRHAGAADAAPAGGNARPAGGLRYHGPCRADRKR
jgi:hypothetical protein